MTERAFTLIELIIVFIIIGILAVLTLPQFTKTKERALDKEATANLKLLQAAEKIYRMEMSIYLACSDASCINTNLKLSLPTGTTRNWDYSIPTASASAFTAQAARHNPPTDWSRTWSIDQDDDEASCSGDNCPAP